MRNHKYIMIKKKGEWKIVEYQEQNNEIKI